MVAAVGGTGERKARLHEDPQNLTLRAESEDVRARGAQEPFPGPKERARRRWKLREHAQKLASRARRTLEQIEQLHVADAAHRAPNRLDAGER